MKPYERVFKNLTVRLVPLGFTRHGSTWWQVRRGRIWYRVHIHKFRAGDYFRVHAAIHAVGFEDKAPWLNGPTSHDGWFEEKKFGARVRRYEFRFQDSDESLSRCADELRDYIERCVMPWFEHWIKERTLIEAADSPLTEGAKEFLKKEVNQTTEPTDQSGHGSS